MKKFNILFLPYAGGNRYSYRKYEEIAPDFLNIIPMEYPGRGSRISEPLVKDMHMLVSDLYQQVKNIVDQGSYAIYGHSMGGLAAILLARKLADNNHPPPIHIFITGTTGPSAPSREEKKRHLLGKKEFITEIRELEGSPDEILDNEELLNYFEPILRADFTISENYTYHEHEPLDIPLTVITGMQEDMTTEDIQLWQKESKYRVDFRRMPGKHFFIFNQSFRILEIISKKILAHSKTYQI